MIHHRPSPDGADEVVQQALVGLLRGPIPPGHSGFYALGERQLGLSEAHRVHHAGLDAVLDGDLLDDAEPDAWRWFVYDGATVVGDALAVEDDGGDLVFAGLHTGPHAAACIEALAIAELTPAVREVEYELRYLVVPGVNLCSLWLHSELEDLVIPVHRAPRGLVTNYAHDAAEVAEALVPLAARCRDHHAGLGRRPTAP